MSRYDWGQRHPGIDRLEQQISGARRGRPLRLVALPW